jgi:hypothetical protein
MPRKTAPRAANVKTKIIFSLGEGVFHDFLRAEKAVFARGVPHFLGECAAVCRKIPVVFAQFTPQKCGTPRHTSGEKLHIWTVRSTDKRSVALQAIESL